MLCKFVYNLSAFLRHFRLMGKIMGSKLVDISTSDQIKTFVFDALEKVRLTLMGVTLGILLLDLFYGLIFHHVQF